jgi:hypothetical protein
MYKALDAEGYNFLMVLSVGVWIPKQNFFGLRMRGY